MLDLSKEAILQPIKYRDYDGQIKVIEPKKALAFNTDYLPYDTQAITYYTVSMLAEQANLDYENCKVETERIHANVYNRTLKEVTASEGRKPSEARLNYLLAEDNDVQAAQVKLNQVRYNYQVLVALRKAFEQRKDLMQTLAANQRAEYTRGSNFGFLRDSSGNLRDNQFNIHEIDESQQIDAKTKEFIEKHDYTQGVNK